MVKSNPFFCFSFLSSVATELKPRIVLDNLFVSGYLKNILSMVEIILLLFLLFVTEYCRHFILLLSFLSKGFFLGEEHT